MPAISKGRSAGARNSSRWSGYWLPRPARARRLNGATFLGLNGIAIKSHGGTDALGFASAIDVGYGMARSGIVERLTRDLAALQAKLDMIPVLTEDQRLDTAAAG